MHVHRPTRAYQSGTFSPIDFSVLGNIFNFSGKCCSGNVVGYNVESIASVKFD